MYHFKIKQLGQTIIETVIALSIILIILAAIATAIITSTSNSKFLKDQTLANKHAQGGMEYIRFLRNTNPSSFKAKDGYKCMNEDNTFDVGQCTAVNIQNAFKREVEFIQDSTYCGEDPNDRGNYGTEVRVAVYWSSGKCTDLNTFCHKVELISCFSDQSAGSQL